MTTDPRYAILVGEKTGPRHPSLCQKSALFTKPDCWLGPTGRAFAFRQSRRKDWVKMTEQEIKRIQERIDRVWLRAYDVRLTDAERLAASKVAMRLMAQIRMYPPV